MYVYVDVYGRPLGVETAIKARHLEFDFFKVMDVNSKADRAIAKQFWSQGNHDQMGRQQQM